jgi:hypothetical protein
MLHQFRDRVFSITNAFLQDRSDESDGFGLIQSQTPRKAFLS